MKILVAGPGTIGSSLAFACAARGHATTLLGRSDASLARGRETMERAAAELSAAGLAPPSLAGWNECLSAVTRLEAVASDIDLVLEAINEDLPAKQGLFAELERHLPAGVIFASSTSGLPVDAIAARLADPGRLAVAHFANPPHLMPMVEIVPGTATRPDVMDTIAGFVQAMGKTPARLQRDIPGHVFNRIQFAMLREAMALVAEGVAAPVEIDTIVKRGLALRLAEEGPLEKMDLAGLQLVHDVASYLFPDLDRAEQPVLLRNMLAEGQSGAAAGRGFYEWDQDRADAVVHRRNAEVIRHLKRLQD
ncbi:MAG: 3-hydroxyacyl-CoA dehydrogenase family protein [Gammaproteobacteria bacterium]|nr:3-hydroxyacyl-CoA dehydrogenase family protein [Gammaproteobacteria bacterium]